MSDLVPESVSVLRASSARRIVPLGVIGSRMRFISEAATYLSWTTLAEVPTTPPGLSALPTVISGTLLEN